MTLFGVVNTPVFVDKYYQLKFSIQYKQQFSALETKVGIFPWTGTKLQQGPFDQKRIALWFWDSTEKPNSARRKGETPTMLILKQ